DALTISDVISGAGANAILTKSGAGTLTLSGNNTFQGNVFLNGGMLITAMGNTTTGNLGGSAAVGTTFKQLFISNNAVFRTTSNFNDNTPSATNLGIVFNIGAGGGTLDTPTGVTITIDDGNGAGTAAGNAEL